MKKPVMGIQLYTLRDFCQTAEDFDKTLARLSAMGVTDVQISGIGPIPAEVQKEILEKNHMKVCITHKDFGRMQNDLEALMQEHKVIGCDALGIGSMPGSARGSAAALRAFVKEANAIGARMKANGQSFHYHNHAFEFERLGDRACNAMDILLEETDPSLFNFIPDVAWIHYAQRDPVEIMSLMKGRIKVMHFKDYALDNDKMRHFVSLGKGLVDLEACYAFACENEIPYIMYEQDTDWVDGDAFKATEESWAYMQSLLAK